MRGVLIAAIICLLLVPTLGAASLTTTFVSNNAARGNMFDIDVYNPLTINSFDVNLGTGLSREIFVYYKTGSYVGYIGNAGAWTLLGSQTVTSSGTDVPTPVGVGGLYLAAGSYALFVTTDGLTAGAFHYTNGTDTYSNADLAIYSGVGTYVPFDGASASPRVWNGTIHYTLGGGEVPEPATVAGLGTGLLALALAKRFRRAS